MAIQKRLSIECDAWRVIGMTCYTAYPTVHDTVRGAEAQVRGSGWLVTARPGLKPARIHLCPACRLIYERQQKQSVHVRAKGGRKNERL